MCWSKFNLLSNFIPRYFVELDSLIGMSFMKIFGNAGSAVCVYVCSVCSVYSVCSVCICVYMCVVSV